jgi:peptide/nickel transport system ATP-binding protein
VLIARALLLDVQLLVADEIISMLDASARVDVPNLLVSLKRAGLAILFITHDLSLSNYISDRTVILRRSAIVEMGPTVKVLGNPRHRYTQTLLAAVPQLHKKWQPSAGPAAAADGRVTGRRRPRWSPRRWWSASQDTSWPRETCNSCRREAAWCRQGTNGSR